MRLIYISIFLFLFTGCLPPQYITEKYIKNNLEVHEINKFSSIRLYPIFRGNVYGGKDYLELTGYKIGKRKGLLIGCIKNKILVDEKNKGKLDELFFIDLTVDQCKMIIDNHFTLIERIMLEHYKFNEAVYYDFTVSNDLWISFKRGRGSKYTDLMDLWIKGDKYTVFTSNIMLEMKKFMAY